MRTFNWISLGCAAAAALFLFAALITAGQTKPIVFLPVLIAAVPLAFRDTWGERPVIFFALLGLVIFVLLGILSIGWFYLPSAIAMLLALVWPVKHLKTKSWND